MSNIDVNRLTSIHCLPSYFTITENGVVLVEAGDILTSLGVDTGNEVVGVYAQAVEDDDEPHNAWWSQIPFDETGHGRAGVPLVLASERVIPLEVEFHLERDAESKLERISVTKIHTDEVGLLIGIEDGPQVVWGSYTDPDNIDPDTDIEALPGGETITDLPADEPQAAE